MKSDVLSTEADLKRYMLMALAEGSDQEARALEQKWIENEKPNLVQLQFAMYALYTFPRPLTAESFGKMIERMKSDKTVMKSV